MLQDIRELLYSWDKAVFHWINSDWQNSVFDFVMPIVTNFSYWKFPIFVILLALFIWGGKKGRWAVILGVVAVGLADLSSHLILKTIFERVRPCSDLPNVHLLLYNNCPTTYSFPSNHAVNCFSAAMMVSFFYKKTGIFLFLIAILVAISRVYVGVHYPFDTVGGAIWGVLGASLILVSANKIFKGKIQAVRRKEQPKGTVDWEKLISSKEI
ncbi:MAG: Phosphoesterase PA-phosphatase related protein [candidate division Zixibacteria bacterium RBG-1]|nr:MAG: Phosphoesterase PA-phosphatase related protein [candidate division Zixibacteria bacterium RBG-1]OGC85904.1 MAG: hypothetical protein A2V73_08100 [candidate division Zixibacteria bacterium RBG_19FT_COMBO_42_43]